MTGFAITRLRSCGAACLAAGLMIALATPAQAQDKPDNWLSHLFQPQTAPRSQSSAGSGEETPWSGQSGASGNPMMTADAIRAAAADFNTCIANLWPDAARRGITRENYDRFTAGLTPDLHIMDLLDAQPEFTKAPWDYLDLLVSDDRIARGKRAARPICSGVRRHAADLRCRSRDHRRDLGRRIRTTARSGGTRPVIRSTATLACVGRRRDYFREEFLSTLEILQRGDVPPAHLIGSWAGAFGPTQFMPTTFKRFAVDFDGDGHRDIVDSVPDLIASTANNLKQDGWVPGQTWGYEVCCRRISITCSPTARKQMTLKQWEALGLRRAGGGAFPHPEERAYLLIPAGARGPAFLMLQNFRVIMKYNPAEAYALAIGTLADRMRGAPPLVQSWPRDERVLTLDERSEMQQLLAQHGFNVGQPDGLLGPQTRIAIRNFQASVGQIPDGFASSAVLDRLRQP